jgi:hypothetical protein
LNLRKIINGPFGIIIFGWSFAALGFIVIAGVIWLSFRNFGEWSFDEVARIQNQENACDAVLIETNGGATTSFGYQVFPLPRGSRPNRGDPAVANLYGAVRSEKAYGVNLRWQDKDTLAIEYLEARHAEQRNGELNVSGHAIRIIMKACVSDSTAPGGGMLYNLEKQIIPDAANKRLERPRRCVAFIRSCVGEPLKRNVRRWVD